MNKISKTLIIIFLLPILFFSSCNIFDEAETISAEDEIREIMPFNQYLTAYWRGLDMGRYQLQWSQHLGGVSSRHLNIDRYEMSTTHNNDIWYFYYNYIFYDLHHMINLANEMDSRAYRGMTRILKAYSLGFMTDTWGDIPHEHATDYITGTSFPEYDTQDLLYMQILNLLDNGINDLNQARTDNNGPMPTAESDPIYHGNLDQWERAANAIRLRHLLRMGNQQQDYSQAHQHITNRQGLAGSSDDMIYYFDESLDQVNPHYFFDNTSRPTRVGAFFVNLLKEQEDPRLPYFVSQNNSGEYKGTLPGEGLFNASFPGEAVASSQTPIALICYTEQKFMEAEVYLRMGEQSMADQAFEEAVIASLRSFDIEEPDWEAEHAQIENVSMEQIINAKYIALFLNPEVWSDYRRTGYPELPPYEDAAQEEIPRRFLYPSEEFNLNGDNVPSDTDLYTRMWWDTE